MGAEARGEDDGAETRCRMILPGGDEQGRVQESGRRLMVAGMGEGQDGWIGLNPAREGGTLRRGSQGEAKGQDRKDEQGRLAGQRKGGGVRRTGALGGGGGGGSGYETQVLRRGNAPNGHEIERMNAGRRGCFRVSGRQQLSSSRAGQGRAETKTRGERDGWHGSAAKVSRRTLEMRCASVCHVDVVAWWARRTQSWRAAFGRRK